VISTLDKQSEGGCVTNVFAVCAVRMTQTDGLDRIFSHGTGNFKDPFIVILLAERSASCEPFKFGHASWHARLRLVCYCYCVSDC